MLANLRRIATLALVDRVDVYRSPAAVGGKTAPSVLYLANVAITLAAAGAVASSAGAAGRLQAAAAPFAGGRVAWIGFLAYGADVVLGDELRTADGRRFRVEAIADWDVELTVGLSEVKLR